MANFNETVGAPLPLATAKQWTANYREKSPNQTLAHYFGGDAFRKLLNEQGCVGIRIYYAVDDKGQKQLLLVGVNNAGDNLLPSDAAGKSDKANVGEPEIFDFSYPCPNMCPVNSL